MKFINAVIIGLVGAMLAAAAYDAVFPEEEE